MLDSTVFPLNIPVRISQSIISRNSIEERLLEVLKFKQSLLAGALDGGEDEIFMGESKFKHFMATVEKVAGTPSAVNTSMTDVEEREYIEEGTQTISAPVLPITPSPTTPASEFFTTAGNLFNTLAQTFADKDKTEEFISSLIEKDTSTGKSYVKIGIESEEILEKAVEAFANLLSAFSSKR